MTSEFGTHCTVYSTPLVEYGEYLARGFGYQSVMSHTAQKEALQPLQN